MFVTIGLIGLAAVVAALDVFVFGGPVPAALTWVVVGSVVGTFVGMTSGRRYGVLHGVLAGVVGAVVAGALFAKIRPEGGGVTFTRAMVAGVGAAALAALGRLIPGTADPDA